MKGKRKGRTLCSFAQQTSCSHERGTGAQFYAHWDLYKLSPILIVVRVRSCLAKLHERHHIAFSQGNKAGLRPPLCYSVPTQTAPVQHEVPFLTFLPSRSADVSNSGRLLMTLILSSKWLTLKIFERQNISVFILIHCFGPGKNNYLAEGVYTSSVECLPACMRPGSIYSITES